MMFQNGGGNSRTGSPVDHSASIRKQQQTETDETFRDPHQNDTASDKNRIFSWGNGTNGQLGCGDKESKRTPVEVFLPSNPDGEICDTLITGVACGSRHSFIWTDTGHCYGFGNNFYAQLGYDFRKGNYKENQLEPHLLRSLFFGKVNQVACGERHTLFALENGKIAACGANNCGQIGIDSREETFVPRLIEELESVCKIACGANHNLAVTGDGKIFMWGYGRACGNNRQDIFIPELVHILQDDVIAVAAGGWHSLLLTGLSHGVFFTLSFVL
ncbi:uncharacterized protein [Scyliorhinus torazame]|uniref:uncharacterized protein n=1 Tax=Scyliorhinus torazame TaxID=75743 RepID=UPI003B5BECBE